MDPLFSIVLLVREGRHLLPLTLDTLKSQEEKDFDVWMVEGEESGRLKGLARQYPELKIETLSCNAPGSGMMNEAIRAAKGKYVQFLDPGDRFLAQHGLRYLRELISESGEPSLVYSGFLLRGPSEPPHAMTFPLNLQTLQKGIFPTVSRSTWFLRESLIEMGGFDARLTHRPAFDLLCRLYLKQELRAVYSRRVLTDGEPRRTAPRDVVGYAAETCRILYRHFGLWHAFRWAFVQDHLQMLRWTMRLLKQAFWKRD
jgi:glycosyltransferase involved in cell wall biosynthesis